MYRLYRIDNTKFLYTSKKHQISSLGLVVYRALYAFSNGILFRENDAINNRESQWNDDLPCSNNALCMAGSIVMYGFCTSVYYVGLSPLTAMLTDLSFLISVTP
eukprot:Awhi_evm1s2339